MMWQPKTSRQADQKIDWIQLYFQPIEIINNKARHNLINVKYRQMAFRSARWHCSREFFWEPLGQTKVMHSHQRETTHDICCLAVEKSIFPETLLGGFPADTSSLVVHMLCIKTAKYFFLHFVLQGYQTKYVKIPRSQLIDLENSSNQRHFVWYHWCWLKTKKVHSRKVIFLLDGAFISIRCSWLRVFGKRTVKLCG